MKTGSITVWTDVCSSCEKRCEAKIVYRLGMGYRRWSSCCDAVTVAKQAPAPVGAPMPERA